MYPPSKQYKWLAQTLRAEIQSHNQTRDALYTEVQLHANFEQQLTQLSMDNAAWCAAYNDAAATLQQYTQDYTRILADNDYLRAEIQRLTAQVLLHLHTFHPHELIKTSLTAHQLSFSTR